MAGTEGLGRGVGHGGHKGLLLQCWSGVTCPALHPGAPVSRLEGRGPTALLLLEQTRVIC